MILPKKSDLLKSLHILFGNEEGQDHEVSGRQLAKVMDTAYPPEIEGNEQRQAEFMYDFMFLKSGNLSGWFYKNMMNEGGDDSEYFRRMRRNIVTVPGVFEPTSVSAQDFTLLCVIPDFPGMTSEGNTGVAHFGNLERGDQLGHSVVRCFQCILKADAKLRDKVENYTNSKQLTEEMGATKLFYLSGLPYKARYKSQLSVKERIILAKRYINKVMNYGGPIAAPWIKDQWGMLETTTEEKLEHYHNIGAKFADAIQGYCREEKSMNDATVKYIPFNRGGYRPFALELKKVVTNKMAKRLANELCAKFPFLERNGRYMRVSIDSNDKATFFIGSDEYPVTEMAPIEKEFLDLTNELMLLQNELLALQEKEHGVILKPFVPFNMVHVSVEGFSKKLGYDWHNDGSECLVNSREGKCYIQDLDELPKRSNLEVFTWVVVFPEGDHPGKTVNLKFRHNGVEQQSKVQTGCADGHYQSRGLQEKCWEHKAEPPQTDGVLIDAVRVVVTMRRSKACDKFHKEDYEESRKREYETKRKAVRNDIPKKSALYVHKNVLRKILYTGKLAPELAADGLSDKELWSDDGSIGSNASCQRCKRRRKRKADYKSNRDTGDDAAEKHVECELPIESPAVQKKKKVRPTPAQVFQQLSLEDYEGLDIHRPPGSVAFKEPIGTTLCHQRMVRRYLLEKHCLVNPIFDEKGARDCTALKLTNEGHLFSYLDKVDLQDISRYQRIRHVSHQHDICANKLEDWQAVIAYSTDKNDVSGFRETYKLLKTWMDDPNRSVENAPELPDVKMRGSGGGCNEAGAKAAGSLQALSKYDHAVLLETPVSVSCGCNNTLIEMYRHQLPFALFACDVLLGIAPPGVTKTDSGRFLSYGFISEALMAKPMSPEEYKAFLESIGESDCKKYRHLQTGYIIFTISFMFKVPEYWNSKQRCRYETPTKLKVPWFNPRDRLVVSELFDVDAKTEAMPHRQLIMDKYFEKDEVWKPMQYTHDNKKVHVAAEKTAKTIPEELHDECGANQDGNASNSNTKTSDEDKFDAYETGESVLKRDAERYQATADEIWQMGRHLQAGVAYRYMGQSLECMNEATDQKNLVATPLIHRWQQFAMGSLAQSVPTPGINRDLEPLPLFQRLALSEYMGHEVDTLVDAFAGDGVHFSEEFKFCLPIVVFSRLTGKISPYVGFADYRNIASPNGNSTFPDFGNAESVDEFLTYMEETASPSGRIPSWTSDFPSDGVCEHLKTARGFGSFVKAFMSEIDGLLQDLVVVKQGEPTRKAALKVLQHRVFSAAFPSEVKWEKDEERWKKLPFMVHLIMADLEGLFGDFFGECTLDCCIFGYGGDTSLELVANTLGISKEAAARKLQQSFVSQDDTQLAVFAFKREGSNIINMVNGRPFIIAYVEQAACKAYLQLMGTHPSRSRTKQPRTSKPHCHPIPFEGVKYNFMDDFEWAGKSITNIFKSMVAAYETLIEDGQQKNVLPSVCLLPGENLPPLGKGFKKRAEAKMMKQKTQQTHLGIIHKFQARPKKKLLKIRIRIPQSTGESTATTSKPKPRVRITIPPDTVQFAV